MRLSPGTDAIPVRLPCIDGTPFDSTTLRGRRHMIAFFRFASCPFCNLRIHELSSRFGELHADFALVAIFGSSLEELARHAEQHAAPFPILADEQRIAYSAYGIERSVGGVIKGMFTRAPTLARGLMRGHLPLKPEGNMWTMPAEFLIDERGIIKRAYYGEDEGDHLPFAEIQAFAQEGGRSSVSDAG